MSERKPKNALREALASTGLPANGSSHGCDVSTTGAQPQQPFIAMTTLNSRLQLALLNRKKGRNLLEKGFTLVELMIVIVIVGILSAVALPNFLSQTNRAKATECTTKGGAILSGYGADALGDATEALETAKTVAADTALCDFSVPAVATNGVLSFTIAGVAGTDLAGKYFAAGCVNPETGARDLKTSTKAAIDPAPTCT